MLISKWCILHGLGVKICMGRFLHNGIPLGSDYEGNSKLFPSICLYYIIYFLMIEKIFYHTDTVSNQIFEKNSACWVYK